MNSSPEYAVRWTPSASKSGVAKLGKMWRLEGRSADIVWENKVMISGRPSRYQVGLDRYIGGDRRYERSGLEEQAWTRAE